MPMLWIRDGVGSGYTPSLMCLFTVAWYIPLQLEESCDIEGSRTAFLLPRGNAGPEKQWFPSTTLNQTWLCPGLCGSTLLESGNWGDLSKRETTEPRLPHGLVLQLMRHRLLSSSSHPHAASAYLKSSKKASGSPMKDIFVSVTSMDGSVAAGGVADCSSIWTGAGAPVSSQTCYSLMAFQVLVVFRVQVTEALAETDDGL